MQSPTALDFSEGNVISATCRRNCKLVKFVRRRRTNSQP